MSFVILNFSRDMVSVLRLFQIFKKCKLFFCYPMEHIHIYYIN